MAEREKRRLPVLGSGGGPDASGAPEAPRPAWQWIVFGTLAVFAAWLPLSLAAQLVARRLVERALGGVQTPEEASAAFDALSPGDHTRLVVAVALTYVPAIALGAAAGGYLVGRWGDRGVGVREASAAGALAALVAVALALGGGASAWSFVMVPLSAGAAALGGRRGLRRRAP